MAREVGAHRIILHLSLAVWQFVLYMWKTEQRYVHTCSCQESDSASSACEDWAAKLGLLVWAGFARRRSRADMLTAHSCWGMWLMKNSLLVSSEATAHVWDNQRMTQQPVLVLKWVGGKSCLFHFFKMEVLAVYGMIVSVVCCSTVCAQFTLRNFCLAFISVCRAGARSFF